MKKNNTWNIRCLVNETIVQATQRIILKIVGFYETPQVASLQSAASGGGNMEVCRIISILTHFFFLACFMFMFLEALHVYAMVASVVHKDGMFTKLQNIVLGKVIIEKSSGEVSLMEQDTIENVS